jgi:uncharacterized protein (DUF305 family)
MKTNKLIYIVVILQILSILLTISNFRNKQNKSVQKLSNESHMMTDGSIMSNSKMSMNSMMTDMTSRMDGKVGDELDRVFLEDMIIHHQGAVDMALKLQKETKRPELQKMASDIIDVQTKEINIMENWVKEWFR